MRVELIPARLGHALLVARGLSADVLRCRGLTARSMIACRFAESRHARALRIDGRTVAVYGLTGSLLSGEATMWMILAPDAARHTKVFIAVCRGELRRLAQSYQRISAYVVADNDRAMRFVRHWGFREGRAVTEMAGIRHFVLDLA